MLTLFNIMNEIDKIEKTVNGLIDKYASTPLAGTIIFIVILLVMYIAINSMRMKVIALILQIRHLPIAIALSLMYIVGRVIMVV